MTLPANAAAEAFEAETGVTPVVVDSGVDAPTASTQVQERASSKFYTEEDLARVRAQEKDKLYPTIEKLKDELDILKKEREEKAARKAAEEAERARQEREQKEAEMDIRQLLVTKEQELRDEFNAQLERERQERERAQALLDRERTFAELQAYRQQRLEQVRDDIMPELIDLITGETVDEIEASISGLKDRSSRILESAQSAMQAARRDMTGTKVTSPQSGPLDINTGNRQFTADDISAMSMNEYAKYRQQLLSDKAQGGSKGLFG